MMQMHLKRGMSSHMSETGPRPIRSGENGCSSSLKGQTLPLECIFLGEVRLLSLSSSLA